MKVSAEVESFLDSQTFWPDSLETGTKHGFNKKLEKTMNKYKKSILTISVMMVITIASADDVACVDTTFKFFSPNDSICI
jgi:hypothetical protein